MSEPAYNWQSLPDFTLNNVKSQTLHPPANLGYDIVGSQITDKRRELALSHANGILSGLGGFRVRFFVNEIEINIGLSGSYGQGRRIRDFYPHNLIMPSYRIVGQTLNQAEYGYLTEFIHETHQEAMNNGKSVQFDLRGGGVPGRGIKGPHKPISAFGFVEAISREHRQFVYAPTFTFNFNVLQALNGVFDGNKQAVENSQKTYFEILEAQGEKPFSQAPVKESAKNSRPKHTPTATPTNQLHG